MLEKWKTWSSHLGNMMSPILSLYFLYLLLVFEAAKQAIAYLVGQITPKLTANLISINTNLNESLVSDPSLDTGAGRFWGDFFMGVALIGQG